MQDQWYGDKRDIVKWGSLVHMAREYGTQSILQVAFFRRSDSNYRLWVNSVSGDGQVPLAPEVWDHFREIRQIERLGLAVKREIKVFDRVFCEPRDAHIRALLTCVDKYQPRPLLVFLDPDTGIAPLKAKPGLEHVLASEVGSIWGAMRAGDVLAFYQHRRRTKDWLAETRAQFVEALNKVERAKVRTVTCPGLAKDVAFFVARRKG
jgi:hypothetical protein